MTGMTSVLNDRIEHLEHLLENNARTNAFLVALIRQEELHQLQADNAPADKIAQVQMQFRAERDYYIHLCASHGVEPHYIGGEG